jgi:FkbM family methyltransferase
VDAAQLAKNVTRSWHYRASLADFAQALLFSYSSNFPELLRKQQWTIGFKHPPPIGEVRLALRTNRGADAFVYSEVFGRDHYRLPLDQAPVTILDLGANIGLTAVYLARCFPDAELACVEPIESNLLVLRRNLDLNKIEAAVIAAAVDVADGEVLMEIALEDYDHKIAVRDGAATNGAVAVSAISVPSIMRKLRWDRIGLVKMDIEGYEKTLLAQDCGWLHSVDAVCVEYHHHFAETELERVADQFGFSPPRQLPGGIWFLTR